MYFPWQDALLWGILTYVARGICPDSLQRVINYLPIPFKNLAYSLVNPVLSRCVHFKLGLNILEDTEPIIFHYNLLF